MIVSDTGLRLLHKELIREPDRAGEFYSYGSVWGLDPDPALINSASIDIRVGHAVLRETWDGWEKIDLRTGPIKVAPGEFLLASTYEWFSVPAEYAIDLRLKSSVARVGWDHCLAFYVDPGWSGVLTMEIKNSLRYRSLQLAWKDRFAQILVNRLDAPAEVLYEGKYNYANTVEESK